MIFIDFSNRNKEGNIIKKMSMLQKQCMYTLVVFCVFYFVDGTGFKILEGVTSALIIVGLSFFFRIVLGKISKLYKESISDNNKQKYDKLRVVELNILNTTMRILFVLSILLSIFSILGMFLSDVPAFTCYSFLLIIPLWLTLREGLKEIIMQVKG